MIRVTTNSLPQTSALQPRIAPTDFVDCYSVAANLAPREAANIITNFPGWARLLVSLRNLITAPFGLSADGPPAQDKIGFFPVEMENDHELIAGFDDKHLNFRVSVISQAGRVFLATWVHPHNLGGKLYLKTILPFHILIAKNALLRVNAATRHV